MKISKRSTAACPPYQARPNWKLFREPNNSRRRKGVRAKGSWMRRDAMKEVAEARPRPRWSHLNSPTRLNVEELAYICGPHTRVARAARTGDVRACVLAKVKSPACVFVRFACVTLEKAEIKKRKDRRKRRRKVEPAGPDNNNQNEWPEQTVERHAVARPVFRVRPRQVSDQTRSLPIRPISGFRNDDSGSEPGPAWYRKLVRDTNTRARYRPTLSDRPAHSTTVRSRHAFLVRWNLLGFFWIFDIDEGVDFVTGWKWLFGERDFLKNQM